MSDVGSEQAILKKIRDPNKKKGGKKKKGDKKKNGDKKEKVDANKNRCQNENSEPTIFCTSIVKVRFLVVRVLFFY